MIPEVSKLNWSSECPAFEDVEGKTVIYEYNFKGKLNIYVIKSMTEMIYKPTFDGGFIRYAILESCEVPLPMDGTYPEVVRNGSEWVAYIEGSIENKDIEVDIYVHGKTEAEAIHNWNEFARKLNVLY